MLICPQCQFENSHQYKVCQRCSYSLTHKTCHSCAERVQVDAANCSSCGSFIGTLWWVIVNTSDGGQPPKFGETPFSQEVYLDKSRRYKLIPNQTGKLLTEIEPYSTEHSYQGKVLDYHPLEKSVLTSLFEQKNSFTQDLEGDTKDLEKRFTLWREIGIPKLAFPYLSLKEFFPTVPEIHEAWQEGDKEIVLLRDRSNWLDLSIFWQEEPLSTLQVLYCLEKIAALWENLLKNKCCQSLMLERNLRIDEDQIFGLQQLYPDKKERALNFKDLGRFWQGLLNQSKQPIAKPLEALLEQMVQGEFTNAQELSASVQNIAEDEQSRQNIEITQEQEVDLPLSYLSPLNVEQDQEVTKPENYETTQEDVEEPEELVTEVLPMQLQSVVEAACTDVGRARQHNEDSYGLKTHIRRQQNNKGKKVQARGLYIVCDGMGGHASGEVASAMAVETIQKYMKDGWKNRFPDKETVRLAILEANQAIYDINQSNASSGSGRMGTTLVMVIIQDTRIAVAHVGDSRVYRLNRKWGLEQLTVDHEVGQRQIQQGIEPSVAYSRPDAYQLTQALGPHDQSFLVPDIRFIDLQEDTLLLLCSDGLSDNNFIENNYQEYLIPLISSSNDLETGLNRFIELANQENGHDNITGVLVRVKVRPYLEQNFVF